MLDLVEVRIEDSNRVIRVIQQVGILLLVVELLVILTHHLQHLVELQQFIQLELNRDMLDNKDSSNKISLENQIGEMRDEMTGMKDMDVRGVAMSRKRGEGRKDKEMILKAVMMKGERKVNKVGKVVAHS